MAPSSRRDMPPVARGFALATAIVACIGLPVAMIIANKSAPASLGLAAVLATIAAGLGRGWGTVLASYRAMLGTGTAAVCLGLTGLAVLSILWSIDPAMSRRGLIEGVPELLFGWGLAAAWPLVVEKRDLRFLVLGLLTAVILLAIEAKLGMRLHNLVKARAESYDLKRSAIPLLMLLWPTFALQPRRTPIGLMAGLILAVGIAAVLSHSAATGVGLLLATITLLVGRFAPRATLATLAAGFLVLLVAAPWTGTLTGRALNAHTEAMLSGQHASHRLQIWQAFEEHIHERMLLGHGFNSSFRLASVVVQGGDASNLPGDRAIENIHPHNVLLQMWIEFGLVGAVLVAITIGLVTRRLAAVAPWTRAYRLAFVVSCATVALVGLNAWSPWWLAVLALCLVLFRIEKSGQTQ